MSNTEVIIMTLAITVITAVFTRILFPILQAGKFGQTILEIGPRWHKSKEGTPTMGGIVFLSGTLLTAVAIFPILLSRNNPHFFALLFLLLYALLNGAIGLFDDLTKFRHHRNEGLTPGQKLVLQVLLAGGFMFCLHVFCGLDTVLYVPFFNVEADIDIGYDVLAVFLLTGIVNCTNLTDSIDGLCTSVCSVIGGFYLFAAFVTGNTALTVGSALLLGCGIGFFLYNFHPARIFMGDTGSLFFGALIAGCAVIMKETIILLPLCLVMEWEGVSDILQVIFYKATGRRLFRMAPFHHHLELCGFSENRIVILFCFITAVAAILSTFGIRLTV